MVNVYEADLAWAAFKQVVEGFIPSKQEEIDKAWKFWATQSSQKKLMLQKQNNLRARLRAL